MVNIYGIDMTEDLATLLRRMPKAELHVHIEGTLEPELMFELATRNGVALPYPDVNALRAAYDFHDLQSFLDIYYAGASVLRTREDFADMAWAYLARAHGDNVAHAEIFFDPQTHLSRGVSVETVVGGLTAACTRARAELGVTSALILCFLRHLSEAEALATLGEAMPYREHFIGVGLDSSEKGHPPSKFERVFALCRDLGLRVVAHAGEEGPPEYIRQALDLLGAERIDHGVRCLEDAELTRRLARDRIPLTVCPLSNVKLRVFAALEDHNLPRLLAAGLLVTVNSDDPAYFGGYVNDNLVSSFRALPLNVGHARALAGNSFNASFLDASSKARHLEKVDEFFAAVA